jgi:CHAT domain-containing protein
MGRFYQNLSGGNAGSRAAALSEAKTWLRDYKDETGSKPFRHPAYWSAFVLVGASG